MTENELKTHERLKLARERRGYASASQAAEAMGVKYATYAGHENGNRGIKKNDILRYASFFKVQPHWLEFGPDASSKPDLIAPKTLYDTKPYEGEGGSTKLDHIMTNANIDNQQLAKMAGCKPVEIWRLRKGLNGNGRKMTVDWAKRLAPLLKVQPSDLMFEKIDSFKQITQIEQAKIVGDVAAGRWFEQSDFIDEEMPLIPVVPGKYAKLEQFAFRVVGQSMDLKRIQNGDFVICVPYFEARTQILDGDICVIERRNGHLIERTCKEIKTVNGGFQLWPRSSSPQHQTPIFVPDRRSPEADDGTHIEIIGLVIGRFAPI